MMKPDCPSFPMTHSIDDLCRLLEGTAVYLVNAMEELSLRISQGRTVKNICCRTYCTTKSVQIFNYPADRGGAVWKKRERFLFLEAVSVF